MMVWACMSEAGVGKLRKVMGQLCAKDYVGICAELCCQVFVL